jgi:hypothetical protein
VLEEEVAHAGEHSCRMTDLIERCVLLCLLLSSGSSTRSSSRGCSISSTARSTDHTSSSLTAGSSMVSPVNHVSPNGHCFRTHQFTDTLR